MRSVFTVELPSEKDGGFPTDGELLKMIRLFGWEPREASNFDDDKTKLEIYTKLAEKHKLFDKMPEIANEEKDYLVFFGYIAENQVKFIITRPIDGEITFRLIHEELRRLQTSTEKVIRKLLLQELKGSKLNISNQRIDIYEKDFNHIIIFGRVIPSPRKETIKITRKETILTIVPLCIAFPLVLFLTSHLSAEANKILVGNIDRSVTVLITTSIISALTILSVYWNIRKNLIIAWSIKAEVIT